MLLTIPDVLSAERLHICREQLSLADWTDGRVSAGYQGSRVKDNQQLPESTPLAQSLGDLVLGALERNPLFISASLPNVVYPPMFNRYASGQHFGNHVDNAVRLLPGSGRKMRTDVSATLFLTDPHEYDGGELLVEDTYGSHAVKLPAGQLILYPSTSLHRVNPVTRGERLACFFWVQSLVNDDAQRSMLFEMDTAIQRLTHTGADPEALLHLTGCYHNLLRMWSQT